MAKIFCLNSLEKRKSNLDLILPNILSQCDVIHINTIGYNLDINELYLTELEKSKIDIQFYSNLGSEGRLIYYNNYSDSDYYFTIDDDILYPIDYSEKMINTYNLVKNSILCVHGSNLLDNTIIDYNSRNIIHFKQSLDKLTKVQFPGVGTTCFLIKNLKLDYNNFKVKNMSDPYIGVMAKNQNVDVICVDRPMNWLTPLNEYNIRIFGNNPINEINELIKKEIC